jgi:CheY-like chemotaxis protein/HPt (histidine-containing phosphotransfer) domain-containing protein
MFWFDVRLAPAAAAVSHHAAPHQLAGVRVLVVDDVEMNRRVLLQQLESYELEAAAVEDGFAALAELERAWHRGRPYGLVVIDEMMPGMAGHQLAQRIRSLEALAAAKLVITSSADAPTEEVRAARVDAVLMKPIRQQTFLDCLAKLYSGASADGTRAAADVSPAPQPSLSPRPLKILLAEDNKINQRVAMALLLRAGHEVDVVENGALAVQAVQQTDYDAILMDIQMPELDGIQATQRIRALPEPKRDIVIIAMTAHAMAGAREQYLAAGMDDYVAKPISANALLSKLADLALALKRPASRARSETESSGPADGLHAPGDAQPLADLDEQTVEELSATMPPEDFESLCRLFLQNHADRLAAMRDALQNEDLNAVAREAHIVVSTAGNFGARRASSVASLLEAECKGSRRSDTIRTLFDELLTTSDAVEAALSARIGGGRRSSAA